MGFFSDRLYTPIIFLPILELIPELVLGVAVLPGVVLLPDTAVWLVLVAVWLLFGVALVLPAKLLLVVELVVLGIALLLAAGLVVFDAEPVLGGGSSTIPHSVELVSGSR